MKKSLFFASLLLLSSAVFAQERKIQVAILFDTSGSMDGLIEQAKSRIWNIVNEVSQFTYEGQPATIEFALYHYGNDGISNDIYVQQILPLSSDLDTLSTELFALATNGGSEYCGAVIGESLKQLSWSASNQDLKMIYIAGNESFKQGPVDFQVECNNANSKGVIVNTIFCGDYQEGIDLFWRDGAQCSNGDYFNIDSDKEITVIETPYDEELNFYNDSLNSTYYGYGSLGRSKKIAQEAEDENAGSKSIQVKAERTISKSRSNAYKNSSWDLIDAVNDGKELNEIPEEELPEEFQGLSEEEKMILLTQKENDRNRYQEKIKNLAQKRAEYVKIEKQRIAEESGEEDDDFGTSVNESINLNASKLGYKK